MKLALGTVQFGLKYGINNTQGQVTAQEVNAILTYAKANDLLCLDTARAYGNSESVLGGGDLNKFQIISKLSPNSTHVNDFNQSLVNLNVDKLYGYLFHSFEDYKQMPSLYSDLKRLKQFLSNCSL